MSYDEEDLAGFAPEPDLEDDFSGGSDIDPRVELAKQILTQVHETIGNVVELLNGGSTEVGQQQLADLITSKQGLAAFQDTKGGKIVEGVFDGQSMVGSDGKNYPVPANYASKSRLVEGDILKLIIKDDGAFVFKQIGPIERKRETGRLALDSATGGHVVISEEDEEVIWKVITASVTFFKGEPGDECVVLVPKSAPSTWAAIENIVKK